MALKTSRRVATRVSRAFGARTSLPERQLRTGLLDARWRHGTLELTGWAVLTGARPGPISVALRSDDGPPIALRATPVRDERINLALADADDFGGTGFRSVISASTLVGLLPATSTPGSARSARLVAWLTVRTSAVTASSPVRDRTLAQLAPEVSGLDVASGAWVEWSDADGLVVRIEQFSPPTASDICFDGPRLMIELSSPLAGSARVVAVSADGVARPAHRVDDRHVALDLGAGPAWSGELRLEISDDGVGHRSLRWPAAAAWTQVSAPGATVRRAADASLSVVTRSDVAVHGWAIEDAAEGPVLTMVARLREHTLSSTAVVRVASPSHTLTGTVAQEGDRVELTVPLRAPKRFSTVPTVPAPGTYEVTVEDLSGQHWVHLDPGWHDDGPESLATPDIRADLDVTPSGIVHLLFSAPAPVAEMSVHTQSELKTRYRSIRPTPPGDSVYFECFHGRYAGDNTRPIAEELTRRRPDLDQVWVVSDFSVEVPDGARRVRMHSREWYEELASARFVVTNCSVRNQSVRRPHQTILQAWHGTPFKRLGMERNAGRPRSPEALRANSNTWDFLVSQSPHCTDTLTRSFLFDNTVLEIGYPRDDILTNGLEADQLAHLRAELGITAGEKVALFLPTWRSYDRQAATRLDYRRLIKAVGDEWRIMVRGHPVMHAQRMPALPPRVIDVTDYPDAATLFLLADAMIVDYSSAMFDFSITGKPMIFYVPDLDVYTGPTQQGAFLSLPDTAPGPCVLTTDAVAEALSDLPGLRSQYAERYRVWRETYNPWDDGRAAVRAVDALLAHRPRG